MSIEQQATSNKQQATSNKQNNAERPDRSLRLSARPARKLDAPWKISCLRAAPALEEQLQDDVHVERVGGRMILPPIGDVHVVR